MAKYVSVCCPVCGWAAARMAQGTSAMIWCASEKCQAKFFVSITDEKFICEIPKEEEKEEERQ